MDHHHLASVPLVGLAASAAPAAGGFSPSAAAAAPPAAAPEMLCCDMDAEILVLAAPKADPILLEVFCTMLEEAMEDQTEAVLSRAAVAISALRL